ncbi:MAG: biotin--[acetyl-CoA-carboxylase] ligase [Nitrospiraceae bacterium]
MNNSSPLTVDAIQALLQTQCLGRTIHLLEQTESTNSMAFELAASGVPDGTVIVAEAQTAGRGRRGRAWFSPPGKNLYCSVILRKPLARDRWSTWISWIPLVSALSAAEAIQQVTSLSPFLKWPNDLLLHQKKVGGILCESATHPQKGPFVVVGIGVNVNTRVEEFSQNLRGIATSLLEERSRQVDRCVLLASLLNELESRLTILLEENIGSLSQAYAQRCLTLGRQVRVTLAPGVSIEGLAHSIGSDGSLRILPAAGLFPTQAQSLVEVRAGDVVHLH